MKRFLAILMLGAAAVGGSGGAQGEEPDALRPWRAGVSIHPVRVLAERHVIHAYFNACPESPDGCYVLYYTSGTREGESGDLRILERSTGQETIIAQEIATEDAHRAACQQWSNGGKTVVYHGHREGHWRVMAYDLASGQSRLLAEDRQVGFGSALQPWVPVYGCHWNPGLHRDLELVNVETGEVRTAVRASDVVAQYGGWAERKLGSRDISVFFPVMNIAGDRVFFKVAHPSGRDDFRSMAASRRDGKVVVDLTTGRFIRMLDS